MTEWAVRLCGRIVPFHAFRRSRTPLDRGGALDASHDVISGRIKRRFMSQYAPRHPGQFVRQRDCQLVAMHPL